MAVAVPGRGGTQSGRTWDACNLLVPSESSERVIPVLRRMWALRGNELLERVGFARKVEVIARALEGTDAFVCLSLGSGDRMADYDVMDQLLELPSENTALVVRYSDGSSPFSRSPWVARMLSVFPGIAIMGEPIGVPADIARTVWPGGGHERLTFAEALRERNVVTVSRVSAETPGISYLGDESFAAYLDARRSQWRWWHLRGGVDDTSAVGLSLSVSR